MANENITVIGENEEVEIETKDSKFGKTLNKVKTGFKKYGPKIAAGVAVVGGAILTAVLLGKKNSDNEYEETIYTDSYDDEPEDSELVSDEEN